MKKWFFALLFLLITIFTTQAVYAQHGVGSNTDYWEWCDHRRGRKSIVTVSTDAGMGTGSVVKYDGKLYIITATHVTNHMHYCGNPNCSRNGEVLPIVAYPITCTFANGITNPARVVRYDIETDVCIMVCDIPEGIPHLELADEPAEPGDYLEIIGLGGGKIGDEIVSVRHFHTIATDDCREDEVYFKHGTIPGDSGSPILNEDGEIVGLITGGKHAVMKTFIIIEDDLSTSKNEERKTTLYAPAFGPSLFDIMRIFEP